jgi:hypothetical protein
MIFTVNLQGAEKGYNLGRKYCISADSPQTFSAKLAYSRLHVRALLECLQDILVNGRPTPLSSKLDIVDTSSLVTFTIELFLNI